MRRSSLRARNGIAVSLHYAPGVRRAWLAVEATAIFVALPLAVGFGPWALPKIPTLLVVTLGCALLLRRDDGWDRGELSWNRWTRAELVPVLVRFAALALPILGLAYSLVGADGLFAFARRAPWIYLAVLVLYPWLSAFPQEVVWRSFLFHRYRPLLGDGVGRVAASALLFAFLHVVYGNAVAPALSLVGGWLFARTFARTRSLWLVTIEHALYGLWLFTVGLGRFFYQP